MTDEDLLGYVFSLCGGALAGFLTYLYCNYDPD
jgi:hypothetical protein